MQKSSPLPHTIEKALKVLEQRLPHAVRSLVFDEESRQRSLRSDKDRSLRLVLSSLVRHMDGASGLSCHLETATTAKPLSIAHITQETGLSRRAVEYACAFLKAHGLLEIEAQVVKGAPGKNGVRLAVSDCYRAITKRFWAMLGLLADIRALAVAKQNERLQFGHTVTTIFTGGAGNGVRRTFQEAPPPPPPADRGRAGQDGVQEAIARCAAARLAAATK